MLRFMVPQSPRAAPSPVLVVVDDDPAVCNSLQFSLEVEGYTVRAYRSAADLLQADNFGECSCYVIDQRMPGMSGMDLIARLREHNIATPAILIISEPNEALRARAAKAQVPVVEKPLLNNMLVERIREACQQAS